MRIALHSQRSAARSIALGVERIAVVGFNPVMIAEEVPIAAQHATAISDSVLDAIARGAFHEAAERLRRDFVLSWTLRLRERRQRRAGDAYDPCDDRFLSKHLITPLFHPTPDFFLPQVLLYARHAAFQST